MSLFGVYTEQAVVAGISFLVKHPWSYVFHISIKVFSPEFPCSEHGHYHHGSQQPNYANSKHQTPPLLPHPKPILRPRCSMVKLCELTSASPAANQKAMHTIAALRGWSCSFTGLVNASMGGIDEIILERPGTARFPINSELPALCLERKCSCEDTVMPWKLHPLGRSSS